VEVSALRGRDGELAILDQALGCAIRGQRAVLMVSGEPGIGKTRLLEELAARVLAAGGTPSWGRVCEIGLTPPFWPWLQLLAALETEREPAPGLAALATQGEGDAAARLSRFGEVGRFLGRRAALGPIALLFDDLHAADP
jgi:hypothetical protein